MMKPDIIGAIPKTTGTYDDEGNQIEAPTYHDGFHVNFPTEVPELADYKCDPQPVTPYRVYAGGVKPVAYVFPDREAFEALTEEE